MRCGENTADKAAELRIDFFEDGLGQNGVSARNPAEAGAGPDGQHGGGLGRQENTASWVVTSRPSFSDQRIQVWPSESRRQPPG